MTRFRPACFNASAMPLETVWSANTAFTHADHSQSTVHERHGPETRFTFRSNPNKKQKCMQANQNTILTVPNGWDKDKDRQYFSFNGPGNMNPNELVKDIPYHVRCCHNALDLAFEFLTNGKASAFWPVSMKAKVAVLRKLFRKRSRSKSYLERMDDDLQSFVDVERLYLPVVEKYMVERKGAWLCQLVEIRYKIYGTYLVFEESMHCEHNPCPQFDAFRPKSSTAEDRKKCRANTVKKHVL